MGLKFTRKATYTLSEVRVNIIIGFALGFMVGTIIFGYLLPNL